MLSKEEYRRGKEALLEATNNDLFLRALAFVYRSIPAVEVDVFSENPYRHAYNSGQRSVALTIREILGKDKSIKLDLVRL